jgi:hypothetical protein
MAEERAVAARDGRKRDRRLGRLFHRFRQETRHQHDRAKAEHGHREEARPPAECRLQHAAEGGRDDRRQRRDRAHAGELAAGTYALIEVAHDGPRQHRRGGDAERLQAAQRHQHLDRGGKGAAQAHREIERERGEQHRFAPDVIGNRSVHDLADGEAEQIARQGQLHLRHRGAEHTADLRQRRQIEVDRHRADRGQQGQQRGQCQRVGTQHRA